MVDGPLMLRVAFPDSGRRVIVKASNIIEFNVSVTVHVINTTYTNDLYNWSLPGAAGNKWRG